MKKWLKRIGFTLTLLYMILGIVVYNIQESLLFHPTVLSQDHIFEFDLYDIVDPFEEIWLESADGAKINGLHFKCGGPKGAVLFLHGNAGCINSSGNRAKDYIDRRYDVLFIDYRTFGKSTGTMSEQGLFDDAQAGYDYLMTMFSEDQIIVQGYSIGTGIAAHLCTENSPRQLILDAPYESVTRLAGEEMWFLPASLLVAYPLDNIAFLKEVKCPVTIFHGKADRIIPYDHSEKIMAQAYANVELITIDEATHLDLRDFQIYQQMLAVMMESLTMEITEIKDDRLEGIHFRGLAIDDENNAHIGGSNSTYVLIHNDGSVTEVDTAVMGLHVDLRDVHLINGEPLFMNIIEPAAMITKNYHFEMPWQSSDTNAFLDGMDFWDENSGIAFGDPLDGYPLVLTTVDGGRSWERVKQEALPTALDTEAGFAASGTSIRCLGSNGAIIGLGGDQARVYISKDRGMSWEAYNTPMAQGNAGSGIYSMAFKDSRNGVAVGGNWENVTGDSSKIFTSDGGVTWALASGIQEYRSGVTHVCRGVYIATGTTGMDITYDNGQSWQFLDSASYNGMQCFEDQLDGVAVGSRGKLAYFSLK